MNLSKRSFFGEISNELKQIPKETSLEIDLNDEFSTDLEFSERTNKFSHFNNFKDKVDDLMKHYETQYNNLLIPDKENILSKLN